MRKKIAAGNWKMNLTLSEATQLTDELIKNISDKKSLKVEIIIAPSFPFIFPLAEKVKGISQLHIAAQNCSVENSGAFTGEVSAVMIQSVGASHVIIGHSERRQYYKEDNETLRKKVDIALQNNLIPIFCCGETLAERNGLRHRKTVEQQLWESLFHLDAEDLLKCIIAYEPVWAIGTGVTASPEQAQEMHAYIRSIITEKYDTETAESISILYGGSCNEKNAKELFALKDVDGGLVGGASLKAESFIKIIHSF